MRVGVVISITKIVLHCILVVRWDLISCYGLGIEGVGKLCSALQPYPRVCDSQVSHAMLEWRHGEMWEWKNIYFRELAKSELLEMKRERMVGISMEGGE